VRRTLPGASVGFFHDMAVTEHYYVLFQVGARLPLVVCACL
jgi:hypothetical protein